MLKVNGSLFGSEYFGNNEANYREITESSVYNIIELYFEDNRDITNLIMAAEALREKDHTKANYLYLYYLPYGAMDRKMGDQLFSLKLFATILNKLEFTSVRVLDAHNRDVANKLINNISHIGIDKYVGAAMDDFKPDIIYFPDKGAMRKYPEIIDTRGLQIIHGNKVCDIENKGEIISYEIITNGVDVAGKRVLIVDDICRKGGTFMWAASELVKLGVSDIGLYVTHCETGIYEGEILKDASHISKVYTTNSQPAILADAIKFRDKLKIYMV